MGTKVLIASLAIVLGGSTAYPQNRDILQLQKDMITLQQEVRQVQESLDQNNAVMKALVEKMADQVNMISGGMQQMSLTVDGLKSQNDATTREMRTILTNMNTSVKDLEESMSSVRTQVNSISREMTTIKTTSEPLAGPDELWRTANVDYSVGNFDLAISGLQEFISKYANDPRAPEAHLKLGDALVGQKKFQPAIDEYDFVLQKFPQSDKTRAALLKKGLALADSNQQQLAISTLNEVVKKFPNTSEAASANTKLRELQTPPQQQQQQRRPAPR
jgi:tol-pal system protein YbgF